LLIKEIDFYYFIQYLLECVKANRSRSNKSEPKFENSRIGEVSVSARPRETLTRSSSARIQTLGGTEKEKEKERKRERGGKHIFCGIENSRERRLRLNSRRRVTEATTRASRTTPPPPRVSARAPSPIILSALPRFPFLLGAIPVNVYAGINTGLTT